jgi:arsenite-transporting ATPase
MRLQDPVQTKVLLITLAEPTPVTEAQVLQDDLIRAGINPWAWVVTNSLAAAHTRSAFLQQRAGAELEQIARVQQLSPRIAVTPLLAHEPTGPDLLLALTGEPVSA